MGDAVFRANCVENRGVGLFSFYARWHSNQPWNRPCGVVLLGLAIVVWIVFFFSKSSFRLLGLFLCTRLFYYPRLIASLDETSSDNVRDYHTSAAEPLIGRWLIVQQFGVPC